MGSTLYAFEISNASTTARLMLDHKGVDYRLRKLPPGLHAQIVRALEIAPTVRLLMAIDGIREAIEHSSAAEHARRLLPESLAPHPIPWVLPEDWLAPLRAAA